MFQISLDTWLISDTHFGHGNIVKYANRPENHNEIMFQNWEQLVGKDDVVLHIGDVAMTGPNAKPLYPRIQALPGIKYLLKGNHDTGTNASYRRLGFEPLEVARPSRSKNGMQGGSIKWEIPGPLKDIALEPEAKGSQVVAISHTPCGRDLDWEINIHGHIHTNGYPSGLYYSGRDYRNISVEVVGYKPVRLRDILHYGVYQSPKQAGIGHDKRLEEFEVEV